VEISLSPIETGAGLKVMACVRDVTDRRLMETEERRVRDALDAVNEAVFMFDPDTLLFNYANDGAVEQLGYSRAELLGLMTPVDVAPEFDAESFRAIVGRLINGERDSLTYKTTHLSKDGGSLIVEVALQYHASNGPRDGVMVALARDLTDRQESERRARIDREARRVAEDRERIARDLHDFVIQRLFAAGMRLQSGLGNPSLLAERADETVSELDETIAVIRRTIFALTDRAVPAPSARIQALADAHTDRTGVLVDLAVVGDLDDVDETILAGLEATLTEALSNVARHAAAQQVTVTVEVGDDVSLEVTDDGIGVAPTRSPGFGLRNIEARAEQLGGDFSLSPDPGGGTRVRWRVPHNVGDKEIGL
jgi:PAS domain S-box-containing protein